MRTLIAHTRSYRVERESWPDALMFVAETANAAVQSPQTFVETFIGNEIGKMMAGLREILQGQRLGEEDSGCREERPQYLGVSVRGHQLLQFEVPSDEVLLVRKSERIIGALAVLEKLKTLDAIVDNVAESIDELVKMVACLVPELKKVIRSVQSELKCCKSEVEFLEAIYACCQAEVTRHKLALGKKHEEAIAKMRPDISSRDRASVLYRVRCAYEHENPEWRRVLSVRDVLTRELSSFHSHICCRNEFLDVIKKCYGVGKNGERFWIVVEKLYPHEVEIENEVRRKVKELSGKNSVRGIDGIRGMVRTKYREDHKEVDVLFRERDAVLDAIDEFTHSKVGK